MPSIAEFLGMVIYMYWDEHPPAHFHVRYGGIWSVIDIKTGDLIRGTLPQKKLKRLNEWRKMHLSELLENWELVGREMDPKKINPLKQ